MAHFAIKIKSVQWKADSRATYLSQSSSVLLWKQTPHTWRVHPWHHYLTARQRLVEALVFVLALYAFFFRTLLSLGIVAEAIVRRSNTHWNVSCITIDRKHVGPPSEMAPCCALQNASPGHKVNVHYLIAKVCTTKMLLRLFGCLSSNLCCRGYRCYTVVGCIINGLFDLSHLKV